MTPLPTVLTGHHDSDRSSSCSTKSSASSSWSSITDRENHVSHSQSRTRSGLAPEDRVITVVTRHLSPSNSSWDSDEEEEGVSPSNTTGKNTAGIHTCIHTNDDKTYNIYNVEETTTPINEHNFHVDSPDQSIHHHHDCPATPPSQIQVQGQMEGAIVDGLDAANEDEQQQQHESIIFFDCPATPPSTVPTASVQTEVQRQQQQQQQQSHEPKETSAITEWQKEQRSFNETFNRVMFNIDLDGNGLDGKKPYKPRSSQQFNNQDYDQLLEICFAYASGNKSRWAETRMKYGLKIYDIVQRYNAREVHNPSGVSEKKLFSEGRMIVRQREVFEAIRDCHTFVKHAKQNATFDRVRQFYGNITQKMVNTFVKMCPTCVSCTSTKNPWNGAYDSDSSQSSRASPGRTTSQTSATPIQKEATTGSSSSCSYTEGISPFGDALPIKAKRRCKVVEDQRPFDVVGASTHATDQESFSDAGQKYCPAVPTPNVPPFVALNGLQQHDNVPKCTTANVEQEKEERSFHEKFNQVVFNIDLDGNGIDSKEPLKPRSSQQYNNQDYEQLLEICFAHATGDNLLWSETRKKYGLKIYDIAKKYRAKVVKNASGGTVKKLYFDGKLVVPQREVFEAIRNCHTLGARHAKQNATYASVKQCYSNITQKMVHTFVSMCPACLSGTSTRKEPRKETRVPIFTSNFRDRFLIDLIDMSSNPQTDAQGVLCQYILVMKDYHSKLTYCQEIPSKTPEHVLAAFSRMFGFLGPPKVCETNSETVIAAVQILVQRGEFNHDIVTVRGRPRNKKLLMSILTSLEEDERQRGKVPNWTTLMGPLMAGLNSHQLRGKNSTSAYETVFGLRFDEPLSFTFLIDETSKFGESSTGLDLEPDPQIEAMATNDDNRDGTDEMRKCGMLREGLDLMPDPRLEAMSKQHCNVDGALHEPIEDYWESSDDEDNASSTSEAPVICEASTSKASVVSGTEDERGLSYPMLRYYIGSFAAMVAHSAHHSNLMYIHCEQEKTKVDEDMTIQLPKRVHTLVSVLHSNEHYAVLQINVRDKNVFICDGRMYSLETWTNHITNVLKRTRLLELGVEPHYGTKYDYHKEMFLKVNGRIEWKIKCDPLVLQDDLVNCGPIACLKLWSIFSPGEIDVENLEVKEYREKVVNKCNELVEKLKDDFSWDKRSEMRRLTMERDLNEYKSTLYATENMEMNKEGSVEQNGDNHRHARRRLACEKRKSEQISQAKKAMKKKRLALTYSE
ncbi:hypothetical protein IV203_021999 [Nitzschia inconspicua]|uniref:Integrase catalytic domain-containing protein n=1 Tax=Nitzschia inconspicua TaxID=303405 RepID=A0A9K3PEN2_9STRA|nr:hypothetical protein IV203_021999 [Nitzschia inconspicua]